MEILLPVAEVIGLGVVAVAKDEIVIENEIGVVKEVDHHRGVIHREEARRRRSAIDMLAPDVERRRNNRARLPFDRLLRPTGSPDQRLALAAQDVDHFLEQIALRIRARAGRDFTYVARVDALPADKVDVRAEDAHSLPRLDFGGAQIGNVMLAVYRNPFLLQPLLIRVDICLIWIAPRASLQLGLAGLRGVRVVVIMVMIVTVMMRGVITGFRMRPEMERGQS